MISSCPNYLHVDVSDGEDLSRHQQEVTGGQLVTMSLAPGTVDSNVRQSVTFAVPPLYIQRNCPPWTAAEGSVPRDFFLLTGKKKVA